MNTTTTNNELSKDQLQDMVGLLAMIHDKIEYEKKSKTSKSKNKTELEVLLSMRLSPEVISEVCGMSAARLPDENQEEYRKRMAYRQAVMKNRTALLNAKGDLPQNRFDKLTKLVELINDKQITSGLATEAFRLINQDVKFSYKLGEHHEVTELIREGSSPVGGAGVHGQ